jgi:hypothetical protein
MAAGTIRMLFFTVTERQDAIAWAAARLEQP